MPMGSSAGRSAHHPRRAEATRRNTHREREGIDPPYHLEETRIAPASRAVELLQLVGTIASVLGLVATMTILLLVWFKLI